MPCVAQSATSPLALSRCLNCCAEVSWLLLIPRGSLLCAVSRCGILVLSCLAVFVLGFMFGNSGRHVEHLTPQDAAEHASANAMEHALENLSIGKVRSLLRGAQPSMPTAWSFFNGREFVELDDATSPRESAVFTVLAWISVASRSLNGEPAVIVSNRVTGCSQDPAGENDSGFELTVLPDTSLLLSWGSSGFCNTLVAPAGVLPVDQWAHVGFTLSGTDSESGYASLYVNGAVVANDIINEGQRTPLTTTPVRIGMYPGGTGGFKGKLSIFVVMNTGVTLPQLAQAMQQTTTEGLQAMRRAAGARITAVVVLDDPSACACTLRAACPL